MALFLAVDLSFFGANLNKLAHGGWVPLVMGASLFIVMTTWKRGRFELQQAVESATLPLDLFIADIQSAPPVRVRGTAVFMTSNLEGVPLVLLHHVKHNKVLHDQVVLLSVVTERVPTVPPRQRVEVTPLGSGLFVSSPTTASWSSPTSPRSCAAPARPASPPACPRPATTSAARPF